MQGHADWPLVVLIVRLFDSDYYWICCRLLEVGHDRSGAELSDDRLGSQVTCECPERTFPSQFGAPGSSSFQSLDALRTTSRMLVNDRTNSGLRPDMLRIGYLIQACACSPSPLLPRHQQWTHDTNPAISLYTGRQSLLCFARVYQAFGTGYIVTGTAACDIQNCAVELFTTSEQDACGTNNISNLPRDNVLTARRSKGIKCMTKSTREAGEGESSEV